jgi:hypothetical protein
MPACSETHTRANTVTMAGVTRESLSMGAVYQKDRLFGSNGTHIGGD